MAESFPRVMWLMNHTSTRKFEIAMLKSFEVTEIHLPKTFPQDVRFRGASVDFSQDASLSIPAADLALLNETDWYAEPARDVCQVVNRHFDLIFFTLYRSQFVGPFFLRRRALADNGNLSVVDAAAMSVPPLSGRYPAMEETNDRSDLNLTWTESDQASGMALHLEWMEGNGQQAREWLPSGEQLARHSVDRSAAAYGSVIRECL
jgi:hypothetical protein